MSAQYERLPQDDIDLEEPTHEEEGPSEEESASFLGKVFFSWVTPMVDTGYKSALQMHDLVKLCAEDKSELVTQTLEKALERDMESSRRWDDKIGCRVTDDDGNKGTLKWIGRLQYSPNPSSYYAGVEWDDPRQRKEKGRVIGGDGWYMREKIFDCAPGHGSFIRPHLLEITPPTPHPKTPFVADALRSAFGLEFLKAGLFKLLNDCCIFAGPIALQYVIKFLKKDDPAWGEGLVIIAVLFVCQVTQSFAMNQYFFLVARVGMKMRQALSGAVFDKALHLSDRVRSHPDYNIGRIVNMMSQDAQRSFDVVQSLHQLWSAPLQIIVSCVLLYHLVGVSLFAGVGVMALMTPLQSALMRRMMKAREEMAKFTDARVKAVTEVLNGIRIVKFMVWNQRFEKQINGLRSDEVDMLRRQQNFRVVMFFIIYLTPLFLTSTTFIVYAATGHSLDADTVFPALALFSILRFPFLVLPMQFNMLVNAKVSFDRLTKYLEATTSDQEGTRISPIPADSESRGVVIEIRDASFQAYEPNPLGFVPPGTEQLDPTSIAVVPTVQESEPATEKSASPKGTPKGAGPPKKKKPDAPKYKLMPKVILRDVNLQIARGKLTMIVGLTGSGKSSLLEAMLGSLDLVRDGKGSVHRVGQTEKGGRFIPSPLAYAPQQAWIMNNTLQNNILFFNPLDEERYHEVVNICQLVYDIKQFEEGDQTEIGEKGINLSGGQKQRVSIARAVYSDKDIILMDDPLSAVDPHVGKELLKQVIGSNPRTQPKDWPQARLSGRTRVLVTHQIQFLRHADEIVFMKDGRIAKHFKGEGEKLAIEEVLEYDGEGSDFFNPLREQTFEKNEEAEVKLVEEIVSPSERKAVTPKSTTPKGGKGKLITVEERAKGSVDKHMYVSYVKSAGGWGWFTTCLFIFLANQACIQACDLWLTWWTDDTDGNSTPVGGGLSSNQHLYVYIGLIGLTGAINLVRGFTAYSRFQAASRVFHENLTANVMRAPMSFFDTTPLGRLINRFSKDIDQIDVVLPPTVITFFQLAIACTASIVVIATSQPILLAAMPFAGAIYVGVLKRFIRSNRETKRLDSISKSPIFQHFTETLAGIKTIWAYEVQTDFREHNRHLMDTNTRTSYANIACNRWLAIRLELLGNTICCLTALLAVISKKESHMSKASVGLLALGITYSLQLTSQLNFMVRQIADLEAQMNGVERIVEYTENIDQEPDLSYDNEPKKPLHRGMQLLHKDTNDIAIVRSFDKDKVELDVPSLDETISVAPFEPPFTRSSTDPPPPGWPEKAELVFKNVHMRYRQKLPLVLRGLGGDKGLVMGDKEKIGIVGRTGAGKSTLMLVLYRLVELAKGSITLGGRDIRTLKLNDLRNSIVMIPQDPVLFQGTVRSNLDPFNEHSDEIIWKRLEQASMKKRIEEHDGGLNGAITEGGANFSVGQRQLLCLARALLKRNCKLLLMDEATASIDHATDIAIQNTVRQQFQNYTVLTIAHRLHTIMDSTKILVLDKGVDAEYASPKELLEDKDSMLHEMAQKTGDFDRLLAIATGSMGVVDVIERQATEEQGE